MLTLYLLKVKEEDKNDLLQESGLLDPLRVDAGSHVRLGAALLIVKRKSLA